ncbi:MAG: cysteine desulfurase family protein [Cyclobacteriaceae bacterium]
MNSGLPIFLDYNSTTPCAPEVVEAMLPYLTDNFGNPASKNHVYGGLAEEAVEEARHAVAILIGARSRELIFTSGATESVNLAISGTINPAVKQHIISFPTEHKAVLDTLENLRSENVDVMLLPVNHEGLPDPDQIKDSIRPETVMVCMMYANNETGTIMPVQQVGAICKQAGIHFFCDATQAIGKIPLHTEKDNITMMALSSHKFYGPKGIGALYVKSGMTKPKPIQFGGGHENGLRSGTLNVPGIVGMGKAAQVAAKLLPGELIRQTTLKENFLSHILSDSHIKLNGHPKICLPNTINLCFDFEGGELLMDRISSHLAVSQGSACSSAITKPSHVLSAIGCSEWQSFRSMRFSFGRPTTEEEITKAMEILQKAISRLKI